MKGLFCRPPPSPSGKGRRRWSERASSPACRPSVCQRRRPPSLPPWVDGWIESLALASNKSLPTIRRCVGGERRRGRGDTEKAICSTYPPRSTALCRPGGAKKSQDPTRWGVRVSDCSEQSFYKKHVSSATQWKQVNDSLQVR